MNKFLNLRNRALQTLILGLVVLTFYAYYRTTVNEIRPFVVAAAAAAAARSGNRSLMLQVPSTSASLSNSSAEGVFSSLLFPSVSSNKNSSLDSSILSNMNLQHSTKNNGTSLVVAIVSPPSTLIGWHSPSSSSSSSSAASVIVATNQQTSSSSNNNNIENSIKNNNTLGLMSNNTNTTLATSLYGDTARAIYHFGHDVPASEKCPDNGREMDLVIVIMSAPSHVEARTAIRQTWGHYGQRRDVGILFMLGSTRDTKMEKLLGQEERLYGDVIRGRYVDSYYNLTLKTISSLEWVSVYCNEVKFMLKTDDDMFINVPRLLSFVRKHERDKNVIFGRLARKWKPIRNKKSKYYVSTAQYRPAVFPDFTTGPAYLLSRDIIKKLYLAALDQTYLKLEDVFTTGIVAHKLAIKRTHANEFLNKRIPYNPCNVQRGISIHMVKYSEQFDLWKKLLDGKSKCK